MPDQPTLGILRLSPIKAKELNLTPDQIIRGVVSEDGDSVEISTGNVQQQIRAQLEQWKGRLVELKVDLDRDRTTSSKASIKLDEQTQGNRILESPKSHGLHPKWLMTLLSNPNFETIKHITTAQLKPALEWLRSLNPASAALVAPFFGSIKKIDQSLIRKQLKSNGYHYVMEEQGNVSNATTLQHILSILLKNLGDISKTSEADLTSEQLRALIDYLDANAIEYFLKREQQEIGVRFVMLFSDFPPAEIFINGRSVNPKKQGKYRWAVEVKLALRQGDDIWIRIQLHQQRELTADLVFTNPQTSNLARQNLDHLEKLFLSAGLELKRCTINEGKKIDEERKELLKESGNLDLSI